MENFLIYAILAGVGIACSLCPVGAVVLWRRLPYFGDAIAHAAIFGVVLGIIFNIHTTVAVILISIIFGLILVVLKKTNIEAVLTVILAYSFLSLGLFLLIFISYNTQIDIFSFLFGDILLILKSEIRFVIVVAIAVLIWIYYRWKNLLLMSVNEDLAAVEGININRLNLEFLLVVSFLIGISIKIIGTLLVGAMLIIPAATARNFSKSPATMLILSIVFGVISVIMGIGLSYLVDSASGPSIILSASSLFAISLVKNI